MRRTGYMRPWGSASTVGTLNNPLHWLMLMTIGTREDPTVEWHSRDDLIKLSEDVIASLLGVRVKVGKQLAT